MRFLFIAVWSLEIQNNNVRSKRGGAVMISTEMQLK